MCSVYYINKLVWKGRQEPQSRVWILPLRECNTTSTKTETGHTRHMAYNAYAMTLKEALIKYLHQTAFIPLKQTLLKAINSKQISTWPGFTARAVQKYLPDSVPKTNNGHTKRRRKGNLDYQRENQNNMRNTRDKQRSTPNNYNR